MLRIGHGHHSGRLYGHAISYFRSSASCSNRRSARGTAAEHFRVVNYRPDQCSVLGERGRNGYASGRREFRQHVVRSDLQLRGLHRLGLCERMSGYALAREFDHVEWQTLYSSWVSTWHFQHGSCAYIGGVLKLLFFRDSMVVD